MMVLVTYDVATTTKAGRRRLHLVAPKSASTTASGPQKSVFECDVDPARFAELKHRLLSTFNASEDSIRFYFLGKNWRRRVEHVGVATTTDFGGPLIV